MFIDKTDDNSIKQFKNTNYLLKLQETKLLKIKYAQKRLTTLTYNNFLDPKIVCIKNKKSKMDKNDIRYFKHYSLENSRKGVNENVTRFPYRTF